MPAPTKTVNDFTISDTGALSNAHVTALATGGFVIGHQRIVNGGPDNDTRVRVFDALGGGANNTTLLTGQNGDTIETQISLATNGLMNAAVYVDTVNGSANGIVALTLFSEASITGSTIARSITVSSTTGHKGVPEVEALSDGSFAISWFDVNTASIYTRVYDPNLADFRGAAVTVSSSANQNGAVPFVDLGMTALSNGGYAIAYQRTDGGIGINIANLNGVVTHTFTDSLAKTMPDIVQLSGGKIAAVYLVFGSVVARFFSSTDLAAETSSFPVTMGGSAGTPAATALHDGRMMVVWSQGADIFGRIVKADGTMDGAQFTIASGVATQLRPHLDTLADGRVAVSWSSDGNIIGAIYDPREAGVELVGTSKADHLIGTAFDDDIITGDGDDRVSGSGGRDYIDGGKGNDILNGDDGNDVIYGRDGDDTLNGGNNNDAIFGGSGTNVLNGDAGNDVFYYGGGSDTYNGGTGINTADFLSVVGPYGIGVILAPNTAVQLRDVETVLAVLSNIQIVGGTNQDDTFYAGAGNDTFYGRGGHDTFDYEGGFDVFDGGDGDDTVHFGHGLDRPVWIDLTYNGAEAWTRGATLDAGTWTQIADLTGIEQISGTTFNDYFRGNAEANYYYTRGGSDVVFGEGGDDCAQYEMGYLTYNGGSGRDFVSFVMNVPEGEGLVEVPIWVDLSVAGTNVWMRGLTLESGTWTGIAALTEVEVVNGTSLADYFKGDAGNNRLLGLQGDDTLVYYGGFDELRGGDHERLGSLRGDIASFAGLPRPVWVDLTLTAGQAWTRGATLDSGTWTAIADLQSIENLLGTLYNDYLKGDANDNRLIYTGGVDTLIGGANTGFGDTADFSLIARPIWVDLTATAGEAWTRGATLDSGTWTLVADLQQIENVRGTIYNDYFKGDGADNRFIYDAGLDTIIGGTNLANGDTADFSLLDRAVWIDLAAASNDVWTRGATLASGTWLAIADLTGIENIVGSKFDDELKGDAGNNRILGGAGADKMTGGSGADIFLFESLFDLTLSGLSAWDTITDFQTGVDVIDLRGMDWDPNTEGVQTSVNVALGYTTTATEALFDVGSDGFVDYTIKATNVSYFDVLLA